MPNAQTKDSEYHPFLANEEHGESLIHQHHPNERSPVQFIRRAGAQKTFRLPSRLLGLDDAPNGVEYIMSMFGHPQSDDGVTTDPAKRVSVLACKKIASDLELSREVFMPRLPRVPASQEQDVSMSSYDKASKLPPVEYGYFSPKPPKRSDDSDSSETTARALLSEWKLGADPNMRPPFVNPYDEEAMQAMAANRQFKAFKERLAAGVEMSASQPLPTAKTKQRGHRLEPARLQASAVKRVKTPAAAQASASSQSRPLPDIVVEESSHADTQREYESMPMSMPFSQVSMATHLVVEAVERFADLGYHTCISCAGHTWRTWRQAY